MAEHNALVANGTPSQPARTRNKHLPLGITEPPYRAIHVCAGITYTLGGIAIDRDSRVLDQIGQPVHGLYAAGSATGGIEGGAPALYLGGLAKAVVTGLRAAEHAVEHVAQLQGSSTGPGVGPACIALPEN